MSLFIFLTVLQALVALLLVGAILVQKSEGGGLGVGGSPSGFMSARGAADFLTRATTVLATVFVALSILLAALAVRTSGTRTIDTSLERTTAPAAAPAAAPAPAPAQPAGAPDPLAGVQPGGGLPGRPAAAPSGSAAGSAVDPLKGVTKH